MIFLAFLTKGMLPIDHLAMCVLLQTVLNSLGTGCSSRTGLGTGCSSRTGLGSGIPTAVRFRLLTDSCVSTGTLHCSVGMLLSFVSPMICFRLIDGSAIEESTHHPNQGQAFEEDARPTTR